MKKKNIEFTDRSAIRIILQLKVFVILSNWVFQGMRYMSNEERILKILLDIVIASLLVTIIFDWKLSAIGMSLLIAHTINWIVNGHFFVLMRYIYPVHKTMQEFDDAIKYLRNTSSCIDCIDGVAIYGSYCRGKLHSLSDLDVRVITKRNISCRCIGAIYCLKVRFWSLINKFPMDIYTYSDTKYLNKLRDDESPVIVKNQENRIKGGAE